MGAALLHLGRDDVDPGQRIGNKVRFAVRGPARSRGGGAPAQSHHRDIGVLQAGQCDHAVQYLFDPRAILPHRKPALAHAGGEAVQVVFQAEEHAVADMHHIVGGVGARQTPIEHRDSGLGDRHEATVDIGGAFAEIRHDPEITPVARRRKPHAASHGPLRNAAVSSYSSSAERKPEETACRATCPP